MRMGGVSDFIVDLLSAGASAVGKQIAKSDDKDKSKDKDKDKDKSKDKTAAVAPPSVGDVKSQATMEVIVIGIGIYLLLEATR